MIPVDAGFVYPKTGLDADLRFDTTPVYAGSGSMSLDGTNDRLDCDGAEWASTGAWTIACWVKCLGTRTSAHHLMAATDGSNTLDLYISGGASGNVQLHDGNSGQNIASNAPLFDGTWHHFAITCGAGGGATATLYFDGQVQGTITCTCDDLSSATTLHVGSNTAGSSCFAGNISNFGIWESALNQASIRSLMTASSYAEVVSKSGATPKEFWVLDTDGDASVGQDGTLTNGAVIVGDRAKVPNGFDLTGNRLDARCVSGRAWVNDGAGDFLTTELGAGLGDTFSISIWGKRDAGTGATTDYLINTGSPSGAGNGISISITNNNPGLAYFFDNGTSVNTTSRIFYGKWHHYVLTVAPGAGNVKLYVDGVDGTPSHSVDVDISDTTFDVGRYLGNAHFFIGSLADIRVYNVTLSQAQVTQLFDKPNDSLIPAGLADANLLNWWPLADYDVTGADSCDGLYFQDVKGSKPLLSTNGIMEFAQPNIFQLGLRGSSSRCLFNDSNTVMQLSPSGTDIDCSGAFTYLFWFNTFTANTDARLLDANAGAGPVVFIDSGSTSSYVRVRTKIDFGGSYHTWDTPNNVIPVGEWVHLGITFAGGDSNEVVYYVNGSSVAVTNPTGTPSGSQGADSGVKDVGGTGATVVWGGFISELAIFAGTQLDADAVAAVYNSGVQGFNLLADSGNYDNSANLDGWWKLDNPVSIADLKGSTDGAWNNVPNMATIPEGTTEGLSTMGTLTQRANPYVFAGAPLIAGALANGTALQLPPIQFGTGNWTIHFWYKISHDHPGGTSNGRLIHSAGSAGYINLIAYEADNYWCYIQGASGAINANALNVTSGDVCGDWVQMCIRREGASTFAFHSRKIDGTVGLDNSDNKTGTDPGAINLDSPHGLRFGAGHNDTNPYNNASGASFCGVRIWVGEAITDAQINELFEADARFLRSL